ncbi:MAG: YjbQ family protein [Actinobacteria bacterium]|nr:MAG: YjbQ family protein [Actinomycetota bacterium]
MKRSTPSRYVSSQPFAPETLDIGCVGYPSVLREFEVETERRTQVVDVTDRVRDVLGEGNGASAALVYVPHTTAGVTINEHIDPDLKQDFEMALEQIVADQWGWRHEDVDGPNAPSHVRGSLIGPQVLVPLREGSLALGTYQGIFFCEFDGPRRRKVYVTPLA